MHVVTCEAPYPVVNINLPTFPLVTVRPTSIEASLGLQQCMAALKEMEVKFDLRSSGIFTNLIAIVCLA